MMYHTTLNFEVYSIGRSENPPEGILSPDSPPSPNPWKGLSGTHAPQFNKTYDAQIPNILNLVYLLPLGVDSFNFTFKEVLTIYSACLYSNPDIIYLHTNAPPAAINDARSGQQGKWNSIILNTPQLVIKHAESPSIADNGIEITHMEHKSDFVRVAALEEYGGMYLDMDAIPLRDLRPLLEMGFNTVLGRQVNGEVMSGNFFGKAGCKFFTRWKAEMHEVYDNEAWVTHSNIAMTRIAKQLARVDREVLIMEPPILGPIYWSGKATQAFYGVHGDVESNLDGFTDGAVLKDFTENVEDQWDETKKKDFPEWQNDYSDTPEKRLR
ncbi:related to glycosyl transferase [Cephalotrichum gorgonifer]|uniref:Related to glycosyl transferase n=1 Tax=Cephalotrichum gorgonifer TaxID=2041049 RepID=A0AAE8MW24_9PEZI|nr:related to glycosyl transferase [Cephalotrichum gorgonifer]